MLSKNQLMRAIDEENDAVWRNFRCMMACWIIVLLVTFTWALTLSLTTGTLIAAGLSLICSIMGIFLLANTANKVNSMMKMCQAMASS